MLNLHKEKSITIDNNHTVFEDSDFQEFKFSITLTQPTKTQFRNYRKQCTNRKGVVDDQKLTTILWDNHVIGWTGLVDEYEKEIKFSEENKKVLDEQCFLFVSRVTSVCLTDISKSEDIKKK